MTTTERLILRALLVLLWRAFRFGPKQANAAEKQLILDIDAELEAADPADEDRP